MSLPVALTLAVLIGVVIGIILMGLLSSAKKSDADYLDDDSDVGQIGDAMSVEEMKRYSAHSYLLNRLSDMQSAPYYATARGVLSQAESAIVNLEAELESLRKQLEEAQTARNYNAKQCLQLQDEIIAQGVILRNAISGINDVDRELHDCRSSTEAQITLRDEAIKTLRRFWSGSHWKGVSHQDCRDIESAFAAQFKEQP